MNPYRAYVAFTEQLHAALRGFAVDPEVAGFKSIACYRTGLNIAVMQEGHTVEQCVTMVMLRYEATRKLRLADKSLNDYIVNIALQISAECGKPGESASPPSWLWHSSAFMYPSAIPYGSWRQRHNSGPLLSCADAANHQSLPRRKDHSASFKLPVYSRCWVSHRSISQRLP